jgi:hypothetical protein
LRVTKIILIEINFKVLKIKLCIRDCASSKKRLYNDGCCYFFNRGKRNIRMVFRNVVYVLFLVASCVNVVELSAAPGKLSQGQYQASSQQVYKFFQDNSFDFAAHWQLFKEGKIELETLKGIIDQKIQEAAQTVSLGKSATVYTLLTKCFGSCAPESKWLKKTISESLDAANTQRRRSAQAEKKPFIKFQPNSSWAPCTKNESAQVFFELISQAMSVFLDEVQGSQDIPQFLLIVRNLKAGNQQNIVAEFITLQNELPFSPQGHESKESVDFVMEDDEVQDQYDQSNAWDLESDLWTAVGEHVDGKVQVFMLAAGVTCVVIGIFGSLFL